MYWKRIIGIGTLLIIALVAGIWLLLATYDYNEIKPRLARMVQDATGRQLHLGGDLNLAFGLPPLLEVSDVALTNVSWGSPRDMIKVDRLRLQVRLLPLLFKNVQLTFIGLAGVEVLLETDAKGRRNWVFTVAVKSGKKIATVSEPVKLELDRIRIENLTLLYRKGKIKSVKRFHLKRLDLARQGNGDIQAVDLKTEIRGQPMIVTGTTGAIEQLWAGQAFPIKLSGTYAGAAATIDGKIDQVLQFKGVDLHLKASGKELADMVPLVSANLPAMGAFDARGRLTGSAEALAMQAFEARIDKSDFKGHAKVDLHTKPKIFLRLESSLVDFSALLDHLEKNAPQPANAETPHRGLFSDTPLPLDVLKKVDADIVLKADHIHARDARFDLGHLAIKLEDRDFRIEKFEATYKETRISGNLSIQHGAPPQVATDFLVQNFNLGDFLKETGKSDEVRAIIDIAAYGKSKGNSVQSLMANLDGAIGFVMGEGYLTHYLDMLAGGLSQKVIDFWHPPKAVDQINCAVVQFDIHKGVAASRAFEFNSRVGIIAGAGTIELGTEKINFLLVPKSKHPELRLRPKLKVSGTVTAPQVSVAKLSLLRSGARGLSTLVVGPAGLMAPFAHLGANEAHPCDVKGADQGVPETSAAEELPTP